ncbi:hypothetical protein B0H13DRAFT_2344479 [Mycena leptocephala]|nr:hypothetical protein B0H13DRAFT_2344479 [Mycena leptocephala]
MFSLPPKNQLAELIVEDIDLPEAKVGLAAIAAAVPTLDFALKCSKTASQPRNFKSFWYQINLLLEHVDDIPSLWRKYHIDLLPTLTSLLNDFTLPVTAPPENLPEAPPMSSYNEEDWYSFSTQNTLYLPKEQLELKKRKCEQKAAKATRTPPSTIATAQAPAKSARKRTASVVLFVPDPLFACFKKVKIDVDEDNDKPVASTSSSAAKGKGSMTCLTKLTPDRIKKITQNLNDVLTRLVKDNKTGLVNQINLFNKPDSEYFVVLVKKHPTHVYKFSSHQPKTSTNRTSKPDLAALPPIPKPMALIPEETVIQRFRFCDHHLTLQEILNFHACIASDVIETNDKLPLFIASLHDATLRLAATAQTHANAVKSAEYYFAQLVDLTCRSIHPSSWYCCVPLALHLTYNRLPEADLKDLEQNAPYDPDPELTKHCLCHMFMLDESVFEPKGPATIDAEADAETDQESVESEEEVVILIPNPKTPPKKPVSSKTDSGKGKDKAT